MIFYNMLSFFNDILSLIILITSIIFFVFGSLGTYVISKKRKIREPWLAFIPVVNGFLLGSITDSLNQDEGNITHFRIILLAGYSVIALQLLYRLGFFYDYAHPNYSFISQQISLILNCLVLTVHILRVISLYPIYKRYSQKYTILFTALSCVCFYPIILFIIRNNSVRIPSNINHVDCDYQKFII